MRPRDATPPGAERSRDLAYAVLRLSFGVNFLAHALVRLPDPAGFARLLVGLFDGTVLPGPLVAASAYAILATELAVGVLLVLGLWTRAALVAGGLLMAALQFGTALRQDWGTLADQVGYALVFFVLLYAHRDALSVDGLRKQEPQPR